MKRRTLLALLAALLLALLAGCASANSEQTKDYPMNYGGRVTLRILSGSENRELEAILERIQQAQDMELDFLKGVMERAEKMLEDVNNIIEGCTESQTAILTNVAPTMA